MRVALCVFLCIVAVSSFKPRNPLKTKKYKCIEIAEDEEVHIVSKSKPSASRTWNPEDEQLRSIGTAKFASQETIEVPQAHRVIEQNTIIPSATPTPPSDYPSDVKTDKNGNPLILSPAHCKQVEGYAKMYGVTDVKAWVAKHCTFAKMYLPGATCEEINILVESCYRNKFL